MRSVAWESHFTITESPGSASGTGGSDLSMRDTGCHPSLSSRDDGKLESYACFRLYAKINQKQTSIFYVQVLLELTLLLRGPFEIIIKVCRLKMNIIQYEYRLFQCPSICNVDWKNVCINLVNGSDGHFWAVIMYF